MYNTVKELHIALDLGLQHIDSNRKQSISPDHKDMALNYAVHQFVQTRSNPKTNIKNEGREESIKRYDDLKELKRSVPLRAYRGDLFNTVFAALPFDYYKYDSLAVNYKYSKQGIFDPTKNTSQSYHVLRFPDDLSNEETYKGFKIYSGTDVIFSSDSYPQLPSLYGRDSKFMIINLVLEEVNKLEDLDIYWEYWGDIYNKDCFIIVSNKVKNVSLEYDATSTKGSKKSRYLKYDVVTRAKMSPAQLMDTESEYEIMNNHYFSSNRHLAPPAFIVNNRIVVWRNDTFVISALTLNYLKNPRPISHRHNQMCELTVTREIVDLAVQRLKAYIKDEGYQHMVNETQILE